MIELIDWEHTRRLNAGTPGWHTLAVQLAGYTPRPARVFASVEHGPKTGVCHVLVAADTPEVGPEVVTPFELTVRVTVEGVEIFILAGASRTEEVRVAAP